MNQTKYMWCLDVLRNLGSYREKDLQETIEYLWDVLFRDYIRYNRGQVNMPQTWQPDLIAYNPKERCWLIVELKGSPPSGTQNDAVNQVVYYACSMAEAFPGIQIKMMIIGPWDKRYNYKHLDSEYGNVLFVNAGNLGEKVSNLFESIVGWCINIPFPQIKPAPLIENLVNNLSMLQMGEEESTSDELEGSQTSDDSTSDLQG